MTKQEEIREGIAIKLWLELDQILRVFPQRSWKQMPEEIKERYRKAADTVMRYEHLEGVVIKVERELPKREWYNDWGGKSGKAGYDLALDDMAGYGAVEPLIE